jgi:hypothetical protein
MIKKLVTFRCTDDTRRNFRCSGFLSLLWEWKHRQTLTAEVGKILFVENLVGEKRRERLHIGECRGTRKPGDPPGPGWGVRFYSGFIAYFCITWGRRCLSDANREKCLLDHLSPFGTSCSLSFSLSLWFGLTCSDVQLNDEDVWMVA